MKHLKHWRVWANITIITILIALSCVILLFLFTPAPSHLERIGQVSCLKLLHDIEVIVSCEPSPRIKLEQVPLLMHQTIVLYEDKRFYQHKGIELKSMARAAWTDITTLSLHAGGSTITQQLARNTYLTNEKTFLRKALEIVIALKIDYWYHKDRILEYYLNNMYMGDIYPEKRIEKNIFGLESASQFYFDKPVDTLTTAEQAFIIGQIRGPNYYAPLLNETRALQRKDQMLGFMLSKGLITQQEYLSAMEEKLSFAYKYPDILAREPEG